jgi:hypothetical protein
MLQICDLLQTGGWTRVWLPDQQAPVAYGNLTGGQWGWAGFDDMQSITAKVSVIIMIAFASLLLSLFAYCFVCLLACLPICGIVKFSVSSIQNNKLLPKYIQGQLSM